MGGPQGMLLDKADAYMEHVSAGCFVSAGVQQENGRSVIYLWGPWL